MNRATYSAGPPTFAKAIRQARDLRDWSVAEAARRCGYSEQQWRNYEDGKQRPVLDRLERICTTMGMDLLSTLGLWARESLDGEESPKLRAILSKFRQSQPEGKHAIKRMQEQLHTVPLDAATGDCVVDILAMLARYRKRMTSPTATRKDLRVVSVNDDIPWFDIPPSMKLTTQHPISASHTGLGHLATVVRIEPGCGAYHRHVDGDFVDSGREFFATVKGKGQGFFQHPRDLDWRAFDLAAGTVGTYPGNRGHCFINTGAVGDDPLLLFIVAIPFPPTGDNKSADVHPGHAEGAEFRLAEIAKSDVPDDLKTFIRARAREG